MVRLTRWQWVGLILPIAGIVGFLLIAAAWQLHSWGISWIWALVPPILLGWRWLLVKWTQPALRQVESIMADVTAELETSLTPDTPAPGSATLAEKAEAALQTVLTAAQEDPLLWEDGSTFWQRCQDLVSAIAHLYHPEVKYPLLNIYIPEIYQLVRGTIDDLDQWMQKLSPALNQLTLGQAYQTYEVYQRIEPSARKLWQVWNWAQWLLNPVAAVARYLSRPSSDRATHELLMNLNRLLREATLRTLCQQAIALYSSTTPPVLDRPSAPLTRPSQKTQTLQDILTQAEPVETIAQKPVDLLLLGRTGAGKSSLINTLFQAEQAMVDVLPSTDQIQSYHWQASTGEHLTLWDTPGYEQVDRRDLRDRVLEQATQADLLLLVTPALDPALQMDVDFLEEFKKITDAVPVIAVVTQVDRVRPLREWQPPYDWEWGDRPKEIAIREATQYRADLLHPFCYQVLPFVTANTQTGRTAWGAEALSLALLEAIAPAKQQRLARFLRDRDARIVAAAKIIDHYTFQMTTTHGLAAFLKSPVLQFLATLTTGAPTLAYLLAEQIPVEQLPIVIGKLQMAYDLFSLLNAEGAQPLTFDLLALWPLLLNPSNAPDPARSPEIARHTWAFGHALVEYWSHHLSIEQAQERFAAYSMYPNADLSGTARDKSPD